MTYLWLHPYKKESIKLRFISLVCQYTMESKSCRNFSQSFQLICSSLLGWGLAAAHSSPIFRVSAPLIPLLFTHTERTRMSSQFYRNMPKYFSGTFSPADYEFISQRFNFRFAPNNEIKIWTGKTSGLVRVLFIGLFKGAFHYFNLRKNFGEISGEELKRGCTEELSGCWFMRISLILDLIFVFWDHILWLVSQPIYFPPLEQIDPVYSVLAPQRCLSE